MALMPQRSGSANLPLHTGQVPHWLAQRMAALGSAISEAIVHHYGRDEFLRRLAHPFWFQSFGAVMGMDWHSSGITTSVIGALKRGLAPLQRELGLYVCGGRGRHSRQTPTELLRVGERTGVNGDALAHHSRLVAKVDSAAVQDGYELYLHAFIVSAEGRWCVVQQGMNTQLRQARRYHWLSEGLESFLDSPHTAIEGHNQGSIINLADARAARNRRAELQLVHSGPDRTIALLRRLCSPSSNAALDLFPESLPPSDAMQVEEAARLQMGASQPHLQLPSHHEVRASDVFLRRLHATLAAAADRGPQDFTELLLTPGVGTRTIAALAMVAEVIHGAPARFSDPARFSFAHGGKDRHPFPVALHVYDETLQVMRAAIGKAKLGNDDRLAALKQLDRQARMLERSARGPQFHELLELERANSRSYRGRSVFGIE